MLYHVIEYLASFTEFMSATVSYQLESPTVPLDDVYFPSLVLCNMNQLRLSLVHSLMTDSSLQNSTTFDDLNDFIDLNLIRGSETDTSEKEPELQTRIFDSSVYHSIYEDFVKESSQQYDEDSEFSNVYVYRWHSIMDLDDDSIFTEETRRGFFLEVANQYRLKEMIMNVRLNGVGIQHDGGGFPTDISETCHWITPFIKNPKDDIFDDLW